MSDPRARRTRDASPWFAIVAGGCIAAALDLAYICTFWAAKGVGPVRILHAIAAGWIGRDAALAGGARTALLGFVTHFGIAIAMAATYFLASRRLPALARHKWRWGALYGIALYAVMTYVVVPLSAAGGGAWPPAWHWVDLAHLADHMLFVGIPCALAARVALRGIEGRPAPHSRFNSSQAADR